MTTLIKNLTDVETIFDQKSWVQDHDSHIEVCATSDHSFLLQISTSPYPLVIPRENLPGLVEMLLNLADHYNVGDAIVTEIG